MFKWLSIALLITLAACGAGHKAITEGTLRDTLFSVEPRTNNSVSIWMTHDDVGAYCTFDKVLGDKALEIIQSENAEVIITYRSINQNDPENAWVGSLGTAGCAIEGKAVTVYKLLSIRQVTTDE